jgi:energy-coupling factor transporter ATP-binding protein EcfA2
MKYKKFIIKGYRGISDITEIDISKDSLIPIIGKNESGKTTCLEAIHAFDFSNDIENDGKHVNNVENLYSTLETQIIIAAEIIVDDSFDIAISFDEYINEFKEDFLLKFPGEEFDIFKIDPDLDLNENENASYLISYRLLLLEIKRSNSLIIERDLRSKLYSFPLLKDLLPEDFLNSLGERFVKALPYILYFDDFRDRMPEKVYIIKDDASALHSIWILYIDELFKQTKAEYSVFNLANKNDSIRRSILTEVQKHLNKILIEEWSKYQFEKRESIQVKIEYLNSLEGAFLQFKIVENVYIDNVLEERYFDISDRSKGFYWYFNFMTKLHFNPNKRGVNDVDTIYLLDEPGSYLHTYALNKLAEQLKKLSFNNKVIYCTHFHNLLNPEFVPINAIRVAEKLDQGKIILNRVEDTGLTKMQRNSAYQPILDALEVRPPLMEYGLDNVILLEGIYDFYSFKMFASTFFAYFPCVSASSIVNQIPYMIFLEKKYLALWDNDDEGRSRCAKAKEFFGEVEGKKLMVLDAIGNAKNTRLEEYYDRTELDSFNTTHLGISGISFYKSILNLFYSKNREALISKYFPNTRNNFLEMEESLKEKISKHLMDDIDERAGSIDKIQAN